MAYSEPPYPLNPFLHLSIFPVPPPLLHLDLVYKRKHFYIMRVVNILSSVLQFTFNHVFPFNSPPVYVTKKTSYIKDAIKLFWNPIFFPAYTLFCTFQFSPKSFDFVESINLNMHESVKELLKWWTLEKQIYLFLLNCLYMYIGCSFRPKCCSVFSFLIWKCQTNSFHLALDECTRYSYISVSYLGTSIFLPTVGPYSIIQRIGTYRTNMDDSCPNWLGKNS